MLLRPFLALPLSAALIIQGMPAVAGTSGGLSGTVQNTATKGLVPRARVTAVSPSQSVTTTADATGHFIFASLTLGTYTLSADNQGFDSTSVAGTSVFVDQTQSLTLGVRPQLRTIGASRLAAAATLIKPGVTTDAYSVSAAQQAAAAGRRRAACKFRRQFVSHTCKN